MTFVPGPVTVEVPATSANLGPGFDCLGVALSLRDRLTASVADSMTVQVTGEGAGSLPLDESHLVVRSMRAAFEAMGLDLPGLALTCHNVIPQSRGLGSSSAAIVGGLVLARALVDGGSDKLSDGDLLALANRIEGHPDNVAPALLGGFVVCGQAGSGVDQEVWAVRTPVDPSVHAVALVPPTGVSTERARGLLPQDLPHADAVANTGRAALLVTALAGAPEYLLRATEDFVHQSFREPAMPETLAVVRALRGQGHAAFVSGAGPTVLVLTTDDPARLLADCPRGWAGHALSIEAEGARVV